MPLIDLAYIKQAKGLKVVADLDNGWYEHTNTYCYWENLTVDFRGDHKLRVELGVHLRPSVFAHVAKSFPRQFAAHGGNDGKEFDLHECVLALQIQFLLAPDVVNVELPWFTTSTDKLALWWVQDLVTIENLRVEFDLLAVFQPPPVPRPGDTRDWYRRFFPGGLPSLGKRR